MTGIFTPSADDVDALHVAADEAIASIIPYRFTLEGNKRICLKANVWPTDPVLLAEAEASDLDPSLTNSRHINLHRRSDRKIVLSGHILWSELESLGSDEVIRGLTRKIPSGDLYFFVCDKDITIHSVSASDMTTSLEVSDMAESTLTSCAMFNLFRISNQL
jgi:hypothetical protein